MVERVNGCSTVKEIVQNQELFALQLPTEVIVACNPGGVLQDRKTVDV